MTITKLARDALPFHHFFDHGIIGSGTAILCKAPVVDAAFHEFSLNGYPHKILHGDWFAGKGIGVCNIDFKVDLICFYMLNFIQMQMVNVSGSQHQCVCVPFPC